MMIDSIYNCLQQHFSPSHLEVKDDGDQHRGHAGSQNGAGHFTVIISSPQFADKTRLQVHRAIYTVLADWIPDKIHALSIQWIH